jgi:hypothetical protein
VPSVVARFLCPHAAVSRATSARYSASLEAGNGGVVEQRDLHADSES